MTRAPKVATDTREISTLSLALQRQCAVERKEEKEREKGTIVYRCPLRNNESLTLWNRNGMM